MDVILDYPIPYSTISYLIMSICWLMFLRALYDFKKLPRVAMLLVVIGPLLLAAWIAVSLKAAHNRNEYVLPKKSIDVVARRLSQIGIREETEVGGRGWPVLPVYRHPLLSLIECSERLYGNLHLKLYKRDPEKKSEALWGDGPEKEDMKVCDCATGCIRNRRNVKT
jgi:hypothetical protein